MLTKIHDKLYVDFSDICSLRSTEINFKEGGYIKIDELEFADIASKLDEYLGFGIKLKEAFENRHSQEKDIK